MSTEALRLWQLISPGLPVGAFHYSQGLEQAVHRDWIVDATSTEVWIGGVLWHVLGWLDLPLINRVHHAWLNRDEAAVDHWNSISRACRETAELREEEHQMGVALTSLGHDMDESLPESTLGFTATFAVIAANNGISAEEAMAGYAWAWCENQVLAATKLVPLGHRAGQLMLRRITTDLDEVVALAGRCRDEDIGRMAPGLVIANSAHETQYSRLFRS